MKLLSSGIIFAACTLSLPAASLTWDPDSETTGAQGGAGTWTDGGSEWWNGTANVAWNNATPDNATFGGTAGGTITLGSPITAGSIGFDTAGYTLGAGTINLGSGFTVTTNADATIDSVMASTTNGVAKSGTGSLTVKGSNTYRGATVVNAGTLVIAPGAKLYSGYNQNFAGFLTVNAGGTVEFSNPAYGNSFGETWASSSINVNGGTMRYVGAAATWSNNSIRFGAAGGTIDASGSGLLTISGMSNYNQTAGSTVTLAGSGAGSFGQVLSGTGGVIKSGTGTWTLATGNTFSGATIVNGGRLVVSNTLRSSATMTANNGSTLEMGATNILVDGHGTAVADSRVITANASTILFNGSMDSRIGNVTLNNGSTLTSNRALTAWDVLIANTTVGAATVSVTGSGKSTMNGSGGIHLQGPQNFNVADTVPGSGADLEVTIRLDNGGNSGGTGSVVKLGGGTMLLNGQMSYTGGTTVNAGILAVDGNQQANRLTNNHAVTVNNTGVFEIRGVNALPNGTNSVDVTVNAGGTLNVVSGGSAAIGATGQSHAHIRNLALNGGTVNLSYSGGGNAYSGESFVLNGQVTVGGSAASTIQYSTGGNAGNSGFALNGTKTFSVADATTSTAADLLVTAEIEDGDSASGMVKSGDGTMALSATNTYSGGTTINVGTLDLTGGGGVSGTIRGTVTVNTGATLRLSANDATGYSTGSDSLKTINLTGGTMHVATNGGTGQNQTLGNAAINLTGGAITGVEGSNIDFFQGSSSINTLASAAESTISGAQLKIRQTGGLTITTAEGAAARDLVINSVIASDGGFTTAPLIKAGDGTLVLTGANTYTGATSVSAGTLMVIGALEDTAVTVGAGGTLSGTGTLGGSLTFDAGAKLDLTGSTLGLNSSDVLTVATGKAITLTDFTFGSILGWTAASADQGTYELIKGGGTVTFNGSTPTVSNMFDFGNGKLGYFEQGSLRAVIVPEPSIVLLSGLGALGLLRRRRNS